MAFPQLRIRTEFSFRNTFAPVPQVAAHLKAIGCPTAAIVDVGTWGHVKFEKALKKLEIQPAFGAEFIIPDDNGLKPTAWCLAEDIAAFYRFTSSQPDTQAAFAQAPQGVIRFCGSALSGGFDYIDLNPSSILRAKPAKRMAEHMRKKIILTSDNYYAAPINRNAFLAITGNQKMTPQHILAEKAEWRKAFFFLDDDTFERAYLDTFEVAERLQGVKLRQAPLIHVEGDLGALVEEGRLYRLARGHIGDWSSVYQRRLEREMKLIIEKDFGSYLMAVADLVVWAKERLFVGAGRGSSAGSLLCYLLRITEVDPIHHGLLFERFCEESRKELPDIDLDFNDNKRELCFEYLETKYGRDNVARIGNVNNLKPKSALAEVSKRLGVDKVYTYAVKNVLIEPAAGDDRYGKGLEDTFKQLQPGIEFLEKFPEMAIASEVENHAWHSSVHAAGVIVSNKPVIEYCTVKDGVAQIDKPDAEYLNLLKIDVLGLRTLGIIEDSECITADQLYGLTFDDPNVFAILNDQKLSGVFQFEGSALRRIASQVPITTFKQIDHLTALARPGPMGGGATEHYIKRNAGIEPTAYKHPQLVDILGDTYGVIVYQEQVMQIIRELGGFSWEDTSIVRKGISQSKGNEFINKYGPKFVEGAVARGASPEVAKSIWDEIYSFGAYGMNRAHTCSYAMISYACAHMKAYHSLEYAAACLRSAKDDEQSVEILRELTGEGINFVAFDPLRSAVNWSAKDNTLLGGYMNMFGLGLVKASKFVQRREQGKLTAKDLEKLAAMPIRIQELRPAHAGFGHIYADPSAHNIHGDVLEFTDFEDRQVGVVIAKLIKKERRDENEPDRVLRRGGERKTGETQFLNLRMVDDSVSQPVLVRVRAKFWGTFGRTLADRSVEKEDWFLMRGRWLAEFSMFTIDRVRCLTNPGLFDAQA